jgi:hypothetical protein
MICDACIALCGRLVAEHRFAFAIKAGAKNVTRFARRAWRPAPILEVVATTTIIPAAPGWYLGEIDGSPQGIEAATRSMSASSSRWKSSGPTKRRD